MKKKLLIMGLTSLMLFTTNLAYTATISYIDTPQNLIGEIQYQSGGQEYQAYDTSGNLAFNGITPNVSGDTPAWYPVHSKFNINDGYYGNGSSWIGPTNNFWVTLDLGDNLSFNQVTLGMYRVFPHGDTRNPGQFLIEASSNPDTDFSTIIDSADFNFAFSGEGIETVVVDFDSVEARFVKLTFTSGGGVIDEIEVYNTSTVPLPGAVWLLGSGLAGLIVYRKKRF